MSDYNKSTDAMNQAHAEPQHHTPHGGVLKADGDHYDYKDISFRAVRRFTYILTVLIILSMVAMWGLFKVFEAQAQANDPAPSPMAGTGVPYVGPKLQTAPPKDLKHYRDIEDSLSTTYGWIDKDLETVRIPISEAIAIVAASGLPHRTSAAGTMEPMMNETETNVNGEANDGGNADTTNVGTTATEESGK